MDRAVYQHELQDPDFAWLLKTFQESNPDYYYGANSCQPITLIRAEPGTVAPALLVQSDEFSILDEEEDLSVLLKPDET
jgi:hypothetical protein